MSNKSHIFIFLFLFLFCQDGCKRVVREKKRGKFVEEVFQNKQN